MEKTLLSPLDFLCTFVENWPYISGSVSGLSTLFHSYVVFSNVYTALSCDSFIISLETR